MTASDPTKDPAMKTVVLDDDPTGTQSAAHVRVLLETSVDLLEESLRDADSVYVLTNTRAIDEREAVELLRRVRSEAEQAAARLGAHVRFVLRGDSTLRGHVFAESDVFMGPESTMLFVPAFPDGGRTTRGGVHYVAVGGRDVPADETEFAQDPVFPFGTAVLARYVTEKSGRPSRLVALEELRAGGLAEILADVPPGMVVIPDVETNEDIRVIARAVEDATTLGGASVLVRSASPLAAALAGVESRSLLDTRAPAKVPGSVLLVCGSHTAGATAQLEQVTRIWGEPVVLDTDAALADPIQAGIALAARAAPMLRRGGFAAITSARSRSGEHNTLDHGGRVMDALTKAVRELLPLADAVVSKGGITSADTARRGMGARSAVVEGQVLPGVSLWTLTARDRRQRTYAVVPGNVGDADTLVTVLDALGTPRGAQAGAGSAR